MNEFTPEVIKFFIDNASGLVLGFAGMIMMYRLCDKHLTKISDRMEYLGDMIQTNAIIYKTSQLSLEKSLYHLSEEIKQIRDYN